MVYHRAYLRQARAGPGRIICCRRLRAPIFSAAAIAAMASIVNPGYATQMLAAGPMGWPPLKLDLRESR